MSLKISPQPKTQPKARSFSLPLGYVAMTAGLAAGGTAIVNLPPNINPPAIVKALQGAYNSYTTFARTKPIDLKALERALEKFRLSYQSLTQVIVDKNTNKDGNNKPLVIIALLLQASGQAGYFGYYAIKQNLQKKKQKLDLITFD